jgi:hypothetical protein
MQRLGIIFIGVGTFLMALGLFGLPWIQGVSASQFEERRQAIAARLQSVAPLSEGMPLVEEFQLARLNDAGQLAEAYPPALYGTLYAQLEGGQAIRPWTLLAAIPITDGVIKGLIVALLVALAIHPLYGVLKASTRIPMGRNFGLALLVLDGLLLVTAFAYVHTIDNLGLFHRPDLATLRLVAAMRLAEGYPLTVVGLMFNAMGVGVLAFEQKPDGTGSKRVTKVGASKYGYR